MSYIFKTEPFCEDCPEFDVNDLRNDYYAEDFVSEPTHYISHMITCKHMRRCNNMVNWLKTK